MSCWVVPSVAAEIWGTSLEHVLDQIAAGALRTHRENDWLFVDVYPAVPGVELGRKTPRPPTYTIVRERKRRASPVAVPAGPSDDQKEEPWPDPEPETSVFTDWRSARRRTSRLRLAPPRFLEV